MLCSLVKELNGDLKINYQGKEIDFTPPWRRLTLEEAVAQYAGISSEELKNQQILVNKAKSYGISLKGDESRGEILTEIFEKAVEKRLLQPTFITHYPVEVSPLARSDDRDPTIVERFELYIAGIEIANAFSELNDPFEQRKRFLKQMKKGRQEDDTVRSLDEDFLHALEYGMPPAAGEGIGIDRLVMILTDSPSIKEVILFPLLKKKEE